MRVRPVNRGVPGHVAIERGQDRVALSAVAGSQQLDVTLIAAVAESFQRALSIDPNNVDALISLGDLYKIEGLASRAQSCYEDVLKITPENQQAKSRLQQLGVKKR